MASVSSKGARRGRCPTWTQMTVLLGIAALAAIPSRDAKGWGRMAHRAATRLAETRLTPEARAAIRDLLEPGESLADASTWADDNSRNIPGSGAWHFVNVPITAQRYSPRDCRDNCVVSRLEEFRRILADPRAPKPRRRMALRYVVHLVEDAHQPMHVGDNRDRGGNSVQVQFFRDDMTNLHQVWDSGLLRIGFRKERDLVDELLAQARRPEAANWSRGSVEDWVNESLEAARQAYRLPGGGQVRPGARLGQDYQDDNLPVAVQRLARAGYRLSDVLNECFAPAKSAIPAPHFPKSKQNKPQAVPLRPAR